MSDIKSHKRLFHKAKKKLRKIQWVAEYNMNFLIKVVLMQSNKSNDYLDRVMQAHGMAWLSAWTEVPLKSGGLRLKSKF